MRLIPRLSKNHRFLALLALVCLTIMALVLMNRPSVGESSNLEHEVSAIAAQLHAPGDENTMTVATSSLKTAQHMRYQIQTYLLQGYSAKQVIAQMEAEYGRSVLADPPRHGFGQLVWWTPWLIVGVLVIGVVWYLHNATTVRVEVDQTSEDIGFQQDNRDKFARKLRDHL